MFVNSKLRRVSYIRRHLKIAFFQFGGDMVGEARPKQQTVVVSYLPIRCRNMYRCCKYHRLNVLPLRVPTVQGLWDKRTNTQRELE